jgi:hypothetical protein
VHQWYTYVYNETGAPLSYTTNCDGAAYHGNLGAGEWEYYNWTYGGLASPQNGQIIDPGPVVARPDTCVTTVPGTHTYELVTWEVAGPSSSPLACVFPSATGQSPGPHGSTNVYWECATRVT